MKPADSDNQAGLTRLDETSAWPDIRDGIDHLIRRTIRGRLGSEVFTTRPARGVTDPTFTVEVAPPAEALRLALIAAATARQLVGKYALEMRGDGSSWAEIFPLLDLPDDQYTGPSMQAYRHVRGPDYRQYKNDPWNVAWYCRSCGGRVTDIGPHGGHPADNETGHGEGCARHQAEVDAYEEGL